mmetsp:Transcript_8378/g.19291  ORF Transcript_8378/g.19291 Transcript_8378/m.19291 type:complete len:208 (-) Transcript_8378:695-1318(-)
MLRNGRHRVHIGLRNVLHRHGDTKLPDHHLLIVTGGHEPPIVVNKRHSIHGPQMLIVLLNNVTTSNVPLHTLFVVLSDQENIVVDRPELDTVRDLSCRPRPGALPSLCIPESTQAIKTDAQELTSIITELNILDSLVVTHIRAHALSCIVHIPDFDFCIHGRRQEQMPILGKEPNGRYPLGMTAPGVDKLLGNEIFLCRGGLCLDWD